MIVDVIHIGVTMKLKDIAKQVESIPELEDSFQDFYTRLSVSAKKYVKAISSVNLRTYANKSDVDEAFRFIQTKVDFLKSYLIKTKTQLPAQNINNAKSRIKLLKNEFKDREFKRKEVLELYKKNGINISAKTVDRDLEKNAMRVRQGVYKIKTP